MEHHFPSQAAQIRKHFYEKYKDEVLHRRKMFDIYFKGELQMQQVALQASHSKRKDASQRKRVRSQKKAASECLDKEREEDRHLESYSVIDYHSESECTVASEQNAQQYGERLQFNEASTPVHSAVKKILEVEKEQEIESYSPPRYYNPKESEEDRVRRFEGIIKETSLSTKSRRKTVKFA